MAAPPEARRCLDRVPHGHWRAGTLLAALRHDRLIAPLLIDGPLDGAMFLAYVKECLGPTLRAGDLVVCDNLASHKVAGGRAVLAAHGAELLCLPADSPDLNPIELAFAKLKAALRVAAARGWDDLIRATADALTAFTPRTLHQLLPPCPVCDNYARKRSSSWPCRIVRWRLRTANSCPNQAEAAAGSATRPVEEVEDCGRPSPSAHRAAPVFDRYALLKGSAPT